MLTYLYSSVFDSPAQTLVNTVNTVGVMGKGIAKSFRERYPSMYSEYRKLCDNGAHAIGNLHLWKGGDHWVLNFPTKTTWRLPSKLDYIEKGLETFVKNYEGMGINHAAELRLRSREFCEDGRSPAFRRRRIRQDAV